jgi:hypothetical protein
MQRSAESGASRLFTQPHTLMSFARGPRVVVLPSWVQEKMSIEQVLRS